MRILKRSLSYTQRLSYETIKMDYHGQLALMTFNRPKVYNAMNSQMYLEIKEALQSEATNEATSMLAITGEGKFYSSGNDLKSFVQVGSNDTEEEKAQRAYDNHVAFTDAFIDFSSLFFSEESRAFSDFDFVCGQP